MKWVKVAIGAVIAIMSIGIIATSVYNMTQEQTKGKVITFEVLSIDGTITPDTYDYIIDIMVTNNDLHVTNLISLSVNGVQYLEPLIYLSGEPSNTDIMFTAGDVGLDLIDAFIDDTNKINSEGYNITVGDVWVLTFEVPAPPQLTGINATLLLLTPLIFAGGVLAYLLNKQNY